MEERIFKHMIGELEWTCELVMSTYVADNNVVALVFVDASEQGLADDPEVILTATVFVEGLKEGEVAIKDYSENEGVLQTLVRNDIVEPPHRTIRSGYVTIPVCKLKI